MNSQVYSNRYGKVILEIDDSIINVSEVKGDNLPEDYYFDIKDAEQIALISSNERLQLAYNQTIKKFYGVYHLTPTTVSLFKIIFLKFESDVIPEEELERLNRRY